MTAIAKPFVASLHLPRWTLPRLLITARRRKQATIDLVNSSPHLLRDIGIGEGQLRRRHK